MNNGKRDTSFLRSRVRRIDRPNAERIEQREAIASRYQAPGSDGEPERITEDPANAAARAEK